MGLRGPSPKPTVVEIAQGRPGKRPINKREPKPGLITPTEAAKNCPAHIKGQAKRWWKYYAPLMAQLRVLSESDLVMLGNLAIATADRIEAESQLSKKGPIANTNNGYLQVSPYFTVANKLREQEMKLLKEFGMSPSSRTRIMAEPEDEKDSLEAVIS